MMNSELRITNHQSPITNHQSPTPNLTLAAILLAYVIFGGLYAALTPAWQAPDEPAHYNYIRFVAENHVLPELTTGCYDQNLLSTLTTAKFRTGSVDAICYENYQPPLYYLLAAPIFAVTGGSLLALRLFSVLLGGLSLVMIFRAADLFLPREIAAAATTFAAFVPMHLTMLAAVNNDSLAELLLATFIFLLLEWIFRNDDSPAPWALGVVLGLILLTKVTVYTAIVLGAAGIWFASPKQWQTLAKNALRLYLPALALALPMFVRNLRVYGVPDVLGLHRHDLVVVGQLRTAGRLAQTGWARYFSDLARTTFHSFWGQFGWMAVPMDTRVYTALTLISLLAVAGVLLWLGKNRPLPPKMRIGLLLLALQLALVTAVFIGLNLSFVQFQGRYFFSALLPLGVIFGLGMREILCRKNAFFGAAMASLALAGAVVFGGGGKWAMVIDGGAVAIFAVRHRLPDRLTGWLLAATLGGLAALAGVSVFWFIVPNL